MFIESKPVVLKKKQWEYRDFVYQEWSLDRGWTSLASDECYTLPLALDFFWQSYQHKILDEIQKSQEDGWDPIEEPNAQHFKLRTEARTLGIDPSDVLLWVLTFGIALVLQILAHELPRRYVTYEPIEFRLPMRRYIYTTQF